MKIDTSKWGEFKVEDFFDIHPTKAYKLKNVELLDNGNSPIVVNSSYNNGIGGFTTQKTTEKGNMITFSDTVDANTIFYQPNDFVGYAHVQGLYPIGKFKDCWNKECLMFFLTIFRSTALTKGFDYGNKFRRDIAKQLIIKLPITSDGEPDYKYMEEYMKKIENTVSSSLTKIQSVQNKKKEKIDVSCWKEFKVGDFFDAERGKVKGLQQKETGKIPVIAAARQNQGIAGLYNVEALFENKITISCNGVGCGSAFYHPYKFNINGDAIVLTEKVKMSDSIKQFITCILDATFIRKYSYEEKCSADKAKNEIIKLPVTSNGEPNWNYMEEYMQKIEEKTQEKLSKLNL